MKDNVTGLLWQNHQTSPATYTNWGDNRAGDASKYAADNASLCGLGSWRLPTADELLSIIDYGKVYPEPMINSTWFSNTPPGRAYWSVSPDASNRDLVWVVSFSEGLVGNGPRSFSNAVRLVRASQ